MSATARINFPPSVLLQRIQARIVCGMQSEASGQRHRESYSTENRSRFTGTGPLKR